MNNIDPGIKESKEAPQSAGYFWECATSDTAEEKKTEIIRSDSVAPQGDTPEDESGHPD